MPTQPNLGYGQQTEASIDAVNQWMRSTPWYQQQMQAWGQDPGHPTLTREQSQQILRQAQAQGVIVDEGDMEIDDHGNFNPVGHKLRNTLLVGGIAAAAIAAPYALGALGGGGGTAATTAATAGTGSALGTTAGLGIPGVAGSMAALPSVTAGGGGILGGISSFLSGGHGLPGYLQTAGQIGSVFSDAALGRGQGRLAEAQAAYGQNRSADERFRSQLAARKDALAAPGMRASNAVRGDILANATNTDIKLPGIPDSQISGGFGPSSFSPATRQLGSQMSADALAGSGTDSLEPPPLVQAPQATGMDSFLQTAGTIGSLLGAIPYKKKPPAPGEPGYVPPAPR